MFSWTKSKKSRALEFRPYSAFNFGGRNRQPKTFLFGRKFRLLVYHWLKSPLNSVLKTRFHRVTELIPIPLLLQTQHLLNSWVKVWQMSTTTVYPIFTEWLTSLKLVQFLLLWLSVWSDILPFAGHCGFVLEDVILVSTLFL